MESFGWLRSGGKGKGKDGKGKDGKGKGKKGDKGKGKGKKGGMSAEGKAAKNGTMVRNLAKLAKALL